MKSFKDMGIKARLLLLLLVAAVPSWANDIVGDPTDSPCGWTIQIKGYQNFQRQSNGEKNNGAEGIKADHFLEVWAPSTKFTGSLTYSEVNLPDGRYTISADVFTGANCQLDWVCGDKRTSIRPNNALLHRVSCTGVDVKGHRLTYGIQVVGATNWVGIANISYERTHAVVRDTIRLGETGAAWYVASGDARVPRGVTARQWMGVDGIDGGALGGREDDTSGSLSPSLGEEVSDVKAGIPYYIEGEPGSTVYVTGLLPEEATHLPAGTALLPEETTRPATAEAGIHSTRTGAWVPAGSVVWQQGGGLQRVASLTRVPAGQAWLQTADGSFDTSRTDWNGIDWQAGLPDERLVCQLSIPGAHDAATGNGFTGKITLDGSLSGMGALVGAGPNFAQTQDTSMEEQLVQGVRAFDLRPSLKDGDFHLHHGIVETKLSWDDGMGILTGFLDQHPTEFLVLHVLRAEDGDTGEGDGNALLKKKLQQVSRYLVDFHPTLSVGDMRGKMLVITRNDYDSDPLGGWFSTWIGGDTNLDHMKDGRIWSGSTRGVCYVQDYADATGTDEAGNDKKEVKRQGLLTLLEHSTRHVTRCAADVEWTFNFASAYSLMAKFNLLKLEMSTSNGYRDNAASTNTAIYDFLQTHAGPTGIMLMDFVGVNKSKTYETNGVKAVNAIISNNFKY